LTNSQKSKVVNKIFTSKGVISFKIGSKQNYCRVIILQKKKVIRNSQ